jgi:hypothetical protein
MMLKCQLQLEAGCGTSFGLAQGCFESRSL